MAARSIKKHELKKFLENELAPNFDSSWIVSPHCTLQRRSGYFAQGFSLFRLSGRAIFRVYLFNRLLLLPEVDNITFSTLREEKQSTPFSFFRRNSLSKEAWFEWDNRVDEIEKMLALITIQMEPAYDQEIDLYSMLKMISREPEQDQNFPKRWSRAVIHGLLGDMQFAKQLMEQIIEMFGTTVDKYRAMSEESYKSRVEAELRRQSSAREMYSAMDDAKVFRDYCVILTDKAAKEIGFR